MYGCCTPVACCWHPPEKKLPHCCHTYFFVLYKSGFPDLYSIRAMIGLQLMRLPLSRRRQRLVQPAPAWPCHLHFILSCLSSALPCCVVPLSSPTRRDVNSQRWGFLKNVLTFGKRKPKPAEVEVRIYADFKMCKRLYDLCTCC